MSLGTIKKLLIDKHCGFIAPVAGGTDIFFHGSVLAGGEFRDLTLGHRVEYDLDLQDDGPADNRGPRAVRVRVLNPDKPVPTPQQGEFRQLRRPPGSRAKKPTWRR